MCTYYENVLMWITEYLWWQVNIGSGNGLAPSGTLGLNVIHVNKSGTGVNSLRLTDAYICVSKLTIIGSHNGLLPGLRHVIIWTNAGI